MLDRVFVFATKSSTETFSSKSEKLSCWFAKLMYKKYINIYETPM